MSQTLLSAFGCLASAVITATCPCFAPAQVVGGGALIPFWQHATTSRADILMIGDSTQLFGGYGWDEGWAIAAQSSFGLYASGLHSAGENGGNGAGVGWKTTTASTLGEGFAYSGAPSELAQFSDSNLPPMGYLYVPPLAAVSSLFNMGMYLDGDSVLDVNAALRFHFTIGHFPTLPAGTFRPVVRLDVPPYVNISPLTSLSTFSIGDSPSLETRTIDLPAASRNVPLAFRWTQAGGPFIQGPFFALSMRIERPDRLAGVSIHTLYALGSVSARRVGASFLAASTPAIISFLERATTLQTGSRYALVRISLGVNDRNETLPSVGPNHIAAGNSAAAFSDNLTAIMDRIQQVWNSQGWGDSGLYFLLTVSPPVDEPEDPQLIEYRAATDALALARPRVASVHFDILTSHAEMLAHNWYFTPTDPHHFSRAGFQELARRELLALPKSTPLAMDWYTIDGGGNTQTIMDGNGLAMDGTIGQPDAGPLRAGPLYLQGGFWHALVPMALCVGDFNGDGGIDGADVQYFFERWEAGDYAADVNEDGGVDGADVGYFFEKWEAAAC